MQVLFFVLNAPEKLDALLSEMERHGIHGATIFESTGMARVLNSRHDEDEFEFLSSVRMFLTRSRQKNYTIMTLIPEEQIPAAIKTIESVVGNLENENTGVVFTLPVDYIRGLKRYGK